MNNLLRTFKERRDSDEGFTLIELMVVVLIIGILLAIAVPTFLNAQNSAKTKAATSNARTALSSIKTVYTDTQSYDSTSMSVTVLKAAEPSLNWITGDSTEPGEVSVAFSTAAPGTVAGIAVRSKLGDCFLIRDNVAATGGGTFYHRINAAAAGACTGTAARDGLFTTTSPQASTPKW